VTHPQPVGGRPRWRTRIAENRRRIDVDLARDPDARKALSPALYGLTDAVAPALRMYAKGAFLDVGCGTQPFRTLIELQVERYLTYDIESRAGEIDFIGDVEDMHAVADQSIDSMLCSEVLEHVPHPHVAIREFARILRPGGALVLSVPFLARLHEEPHDYFRYTRHGLRQLLNDGGFEIDEITETGSLFSFLGHQVSVGVLGLTWHMPRARRLAVAANRALVVRPAVALDRAAGLGRLLPLGYVVVASRRIP
jgi:SAM-dependent methyltransferase